MSNEKKLEQLKQSIIELIEKSKNKQELISSISFISESLKKESLKRGKQMGKDNKKNLVEPGETVISKPIDINSYNLPYLWSKRRQKQIGFYKKSSHDIVRSGKIKYYQDLIAKVENSIVLTKEKFR